MHFENSSSNYPRPLAVPLGMESIIIRTISLSLSLYHIHTHAHTIHPNCDTRRELLINPFRFTSTQHTRSKCMLAAGAGLLWKCTTISQGYSSRYTIELELAANVIIARTCRMNEINELWLNGFCAFNVHLMFFCVRSMNKVNKTGHSHLLRMRLFTGYSVKRTL